MEDYWANQNFPTFQINGKIAHIGFLPNVGLIAKHAGIMVNPAPPGLVVWDLGISD